MLILCVLHVCFRNGYSMFCAELMSSMKDVPSTERMVMCSQQWKLLKQAEKDGYQKRCEQVSNLPDCEDAFQMVPMSCLYSS